MIHHSGCFYVEKKSSSCSLFSRPKKHNRAELKPHFSAKAPLAMASGFNRWRWAALTEASGFNQGERHQQRRAALTKAGGISERR
jgi:hypothetical protein